MSVSNYMYAGGLQILLKLVPIKLFPSLDRLLLPLFTFILPKTTSLSATDVFCRIIDKVPLPD